MRPKALLLSTVWTLAACQAPPSRQEAPATTSSSAASRPQRPTVHLAGGRFLKHMPRVSDPSKVELPMDRRERVGTSVSPFSIDKFEVIVSDFRACVEAGVCPAPEPDAPDAGTSLCNWGRAGFEHDPMNCVDPEDAEAYCAWVGARLPYEDEWQFAYQGLEGRDFPWGAKADPRYPALLPPEVVVRLGKGCIDATHDGTTTCPVGFDAWTATPEGVMDLAGNVSEYTASIEGSVRPTPSIGQLALGASWQFAPADHIVRYARYPFHGGRASSIGFRCVRPDPLPAPPPPGEAQPGPMKRFEGAKVTLRRGQDGSGQERVEVSPFLLDVTRVTVAHYRACVRAGACPTKGLKGDGKWSISFCNWNVPGFDQDPINCAGREHVEAYCRWAGKRPVKTREWVLAVAGREGRRYPWGNALEEKHQIDLGFCRDAVRGYYAWTCPVDSPRSTDSLEGIRGLMSIVGESLRDEPDAQPAAEACPYVLLSWTPQRPGCRQMQDTFRCAKDAPP